MKQIEKLKKLRNKSGVSIALCNKALTQSNGDLKKAEKILAQWGNEIAKTKADRLTQEGTIAAYVHHNKKVAAMVLLQCETDFVAKNKEFQKLAYEIAMQVAAMKPKSTKELLKQEYIRDSKKTIELLIKESIAKLGENIIIAEFSLLAV